MRPRAQSLFPIGILTLLAALTFWLERASQTPATPEDAKWRHDPDYVVEKFTVRRFGPLGGLQNTLAAQRMIHFPDNDTTLVEDPRVSYFGGARPTVVTARQGLVGPDARDVVLVGDVRVTRAATADSPELVFTTTTLTVFPDDEVARTSAPVTITQGASVVRGVGLDADNKTATYKLLSRVTGTIDRKPHDAP